MGGRIERWLVPAILLIFCVIAYWLTSHFDRMPPILKRGIQPSDFPQVVIALIFILTILMAWKDPVRVDNPISRVTWSSIGLMIGFVVLTSIDLFLALAAFAVSLALLWGERRLHILSIVGIVVPMAVFFLFDQVFEVRFPRGLLTNLWYG